MSESELSPDQAIAALEAFVADNDDLLALDERVGRFNIFDALGIVRAEIRHSNFLAWLLDPAESHGQGPLFLKAVLMDLLRQSPPALRPFSPIKLDGSELRGVNIRREFRSIDILIECQEPRFVIAIENKIDSREHSQQLDRYKKTIRDLFGDIPAQFVYLTRDGDEPSDEEWTIYTYRDIHSVLTRIRNANEASIGDDVLTFLDHYLSLIGSHFMDDPMIDELCQTIYKNHRQAIELIMERVGPTFRAAVSSLDESLTKLPDWKVVHKAPRYVQLIPMGWDQLLPPLGKRKVVESQHWLLIEVHIGKRQCACTVKITPTTDGDLRRAVIERLVNDRDEFGLHSLFKRAELIGDNWATLGRINVDRWHEEEGPDVDKLLPKVHAVLNKRLKQLAGVPDALRPIIEDWRQRQSQ